MATRVVIAAFRSPNEAHEAREALESADIPADVVPRSETFERRCADVFDDGYDVVVDSPNADAAISIAQTLWNEEPYLLPRAEVCGDCGSPSVAAIPRLRIFVIAAGVLYAAGILAHQSELFLLVIAIVTFVLLVSPNRRCRECGARWTRHRPSGRD